MHNATSVRARHSTNPESAQPSPHTTHPIPSTFLFNIILAFTSRFSIQNSILEIYHETSVQADMEILSSKLSTSISVQKNFHA